MPELYQEILSSQVPSTWTRTSEEVDQVNLSSSSPEFRAVAAKVQSTLRVAIDRVERIQNPFLYGSYILKKQEYIAKSIFVNEMELFHCTAAHNITSIINHNLDWRLCSRTKFGQGVSFSPSAAYANKYANRRIGEERATILTKVLCGNTYPGNQLMVIPPAGYNTSTGNRGQVFVKYTDYEFYPCYVAYYEYESIDNTFLRQLRELGFY